MSESRLDVTAAAIVCADVLLKEFRTIGGKPIADTFAIKEIPSDKAIPVRLQQEFWLDPVEDRVGIAIPGNGVIPLFFDIGLREYQSGERFVAHVG